MQAIFNVTSLTVMLYFVYAVLGVQLYSTLQFGDHVDGHANFANFPNAISLVFRMSTGENWQGVRRRSAVPLMSAVSLMSAAVGPSDASQ